MASDARSVADELRKQGKEQPAKLAEQAAQRAESLGDYLQRSDGDAILRDLENFGRRQPWAVIAGGLALGFAASRFLKASSSRRYESGYEPRSDTNGAPTHPARPHRRRADEPHGPGGRRRGARPAAPWSPTPPRPAATSRAARGDAYAPSWRPRTPSTGRAYAAARRTDPRDRGIGELVKDLASQTSTLVRQEIKLAQAEVTQKGKLAGKGAGMLAGAAVVALLGLGALTAFLIIVLDSFLPLWLAALIVTVLWLAHRRRARARRQEGAAGRDAPRTPDR